MKRPIIKGQARTFIVPNQKRKNPLKFKGFIKETINKFGGEVLIKKGYRGLDDIIVRNENLID